MLRRRFWQVTLGLLGGGSLGYVILVRGFLDPIDPAESGAAMAGAGLGYALIGVLPLWVFGMWLLTVTTSRLALYVAVGSTGSAVGVGYETLVLAEPWILHVEALPVLNTMGLVANGVATAGGILMIASYPDGRPELRWQRATLWLLWLPPVAATVTLLVSPHLLPPSYTAVPPTITNPYAAPALSWAAPVVEAVAIDWYLPVLCGMGVFASRLVFGGSATRARLRVMAIAVALTMVAFVLWDSSTRLGLVGTPAGWLIQAMVLVSMISIPAVAIRGILRHGAFDVAQADRGRLVVGSSSSMITCLYGIAVALPALLLVGRVPATSLVLVTSLAAVVLLPARGLLVRLVRRAVFGDRDHHLGVLVALGRQLEQTEATTDVPRRLAEALRDGLDAQWVRVRLVGADGAGLGDPVAMAGAPDGEPAMTEDLRHGDSLLGRIDVGPSRHGSHTDAELALLRTIAQQATTTVANVHLTRRLGDQLAELTASRLRLVAAQDDERRRLERDLHDGVQQDVVALIAGLRLARNRLDRGELSPDELATLQDQARETLVDLRELAQGIHPSVLSDSGLVAAVESRVARFPIPLSIDADPEVRRSRYTADVEATAWFVVREALTNTARHAGATRARVGLHRENGALRVEVTDDGRGFEPDATAQRPNGGLANLRDRVGALHGRFSIASSSRSGTLVTAILPVPADGGPARD